MRVTVSNMNNCKIKPVQIIVSRRGPNLKLWYKSWPICPPSDRIIKLKKTIRCRNWKRLNTCGWSCIIIIPVSRTTALWLGQILWDNYYRNQKFSNVWSFKLGTEKVEKVSVNDSSLGKSFATIPLEFNIPTRCQWAFEPTEYNNFALSLDYVIKSHYCVCCLHE